MDYHLDVVCVTKASHIENYYKVKTKFELPFVWYSIIFLSVFVYNKATIIANQGNHFESFGTFRDLYLFKDAIKITEF